jgi:hypothetical protein
MATIELSAGFIPGFVSRLIDRTDNRYAGYNYGGGDPGFYPSMPSNFGFLPGCGSNQVYQYKSLGVINIMKGTMPTDFTTLTGYSVRSADILATFDSTNSVAVQVRYNTVGDTAIITGNAAATATGTATWFWLEARCGWPTSGTGTVTVATLSNILNHQIIGSVGLANSGADLEISSVNVTSGNIYRISNLRLQFNTTFTF